MTSTVCTLFEGHYHYGVAALTNSLYRQGYRGAIYAGYRGCLPSWASEAKNSSLPWPGSQTLEVAKGLQLHFLPLDTDYHLTNYKPDFMLHLWSGPAAGAASLFYFDPDIVVVRPWTMFEEWTNCGVALCEDVNSPLAAYHPRRMAWRRYFGEKGICLHFKEAIYANGGFVGVHAGHDDFLMMWKNIQEAMAPMIGGLNRSALAGETLPQPFDRTDQDALNAAVEAWNGAVSFIGQEGMAFKPGMALMLHALGHPKPWKRNQIAQSLLGRPPRQVDRAYWKATHGPVFSQPTVKVYLQQIAVGIATAIGRFYRSR